MVCLAKTKYFGHLESCREMVENFSHIKVHKASAITSCYPRCSPFCPFHCLLLGTFMAFREEKEKFVNIKVDHGGVF